jgi:hypothetical protein
LTKDSFSVALALVVVAGVLASRVSYQEVCSCYHSISLAKRPHCHVVDLSQDYSSSKGLAVVVHLVEVDLLVSP